MDLQVYFGGLGLSSVLSISIQGPYRTFNETLKGTLIATLSPYLNERRGRVLKTECCHRATAVLLF